jgi:hypothetical protein
MKRESSSSIEWARRFCGRATKPAPSLEEESLLADDRQPEQLSVPARSSGHGKKTADKWNQ